MRWSMFFLLLGVPTALLVGLVIVLKSGGSEVEQRVNGGSGQGRGHA